MNTLSLETASHVDATVVEELEELPTTADTTVPIEAMDAFTAGAWEGLGRTSLPLAATLLALAGLLLVCLRLVLALRRGPLETDDEGGVGRACPHRQVDPSRRRERNVAVDGGAGARLRRWRPAARVGGGRLGEGELRGPGAAEAEL